MSDVAFRTPLPIGEPSYLYVFYCAFKDKRRSVSPDPANWWVTVCMLKALTLSIKLRKPQSVSRISNDVIDSRHSNILSNSSKIHLTRLGKSLRVSKVVWSELMCIHAVIAHARRCPTVLE